MTDENKIKQVVPPDRKFMREYLPSFWDFIKKDFSAEKMLEFGGQLKEYVYKRNFHKEDEGKILSCKIEFVEFEVDEINNKRKD